MKYILLIWLLMFSGIVNAEQNGFVPHLSIEAGWGGGNSSEEEIPAFSHGFTNEVSLVFQWYQHNNFYAYSDYRHISRLEKEDLERNKGNPSGEVNSYCFVCVGYRFF